MPRESCGCKAETVLNNISNVRFKEGKLEELYLLESRTLMIEMISSLVLIFDIDSLTEELSKSLPELSTNTVVVGLYSKSVKSSDFDVDRTVSTVVGFDAETKFDIKQSSISDYTTIEGFDFERERRTFFFLPLFFEDEESGVLIFPYDSRIPEDIYEIMRVNISTAVKGAELMSTIQALSITDELTGLFNRRGFFQNVYSKLLLLSRIEEANPIVMILDLDGLKHINDTYGHNEGDKAILAFATILKDTLRKDDVVGRIGGDEFVIFSTIKSKADYKKFVDRIREEIANYNKKSLHPYDINASIGSVVLEESTRECFETAILCADNILCEEKSKKKDLGLARQ
jgi:diguanylate cyclase (GGDEF)-like protein